MQSSRIFEEVNCKAVAALPPSLALGGEEGKVFGLPEEKPQLQLRIIPTGSGSSFHSRGGAAAAAAAGGCIYTATVDGSLLRTETDREQTQLLDCSVLKEPLQLRRLFIDPTGQHLLGAAASGSTVYVHRTAQQPVLLQRLKKTIVEAVAWNRRGVSVNAAHFLVGTRCGSIFECQIEGGVEKAVKLLFKMRSCSRITDLHAEVVGGSFAAAFSLTGKQTVESLLLDALAFEVPLAVASQSAASNSPNSPASSASRSLAVERLDDSSLKPTWDVFWLSTAGVFQSELSMPPSVAASGDAFPKKTASCLLRFPPSLLRFPSSAVLTAALESPEAAEKSASLTGMFESDILQEHPNAQVPLDFALTKRHVLLLYPNCVVAFSRLNFQYSTSLALPTHLYGKSRQLLCGSGTGGSALVLTTEFMADLPISNEEANVWILLLKQGNFVGASACCSDWRQREFVHRFHAAQLVSRGLWVEAAAAWARCRTARFEDVCRLLLESERRETEPPKRQIFQSALTTFLSSKLRQLRAADPGRRSHGRKYISPGERPSPQQVVIFVWLLRLSLQRLNEVEANLLRTQASAALIAESRIPDEKDSESANFEALEAEALQASLNKSLQDIRELLSEFAGVDELQDTVAEMLQREARTDLLRDFLVFRGDDEGAATLPILRGDYLQAIDAITNIRAPVARAAVWSKFAPLLFLQTPEEFAKAARKPEFLNVEVWRLLPALLLAVEAKHSTNGDKDRAALMWRSAIQILKEQNLSNMPTRVHISLQPPQQQPFALQAKGGSWQSARGVQTALLLLLAEGPQEAEAEVSSVMMGKEGRFCIASLQECVGPAEAVLCARRLREKTKFRGLTQFQLHLSRFKEAVSLALREADLPLAEKAASACLDAVERKALWTRIAAFVVRAAPSAFKALTAFLPGKRRTHGASKFGKRAFKLRQMFEQAKREDVAALLALVERSQHTLSIQEMLPLLPDAALLRDVAPALRDAAEAAIQNLRESARELQRHLEAIQDLKRQLTEVNQTCVVISSTQKCSVCGSGLFEEKFFAFKCGHAVHSECAQSLLLPAMSETRSRESAPEQLSRFEECVEALDIAIQKGSPDIEALEDAVDAELGSECPLCGALMVRSIHQPLLDPTLDAHIISEWKIREGEETDQSPFCSHGH